MLTLGELAGDPQVLGVEPGLEDIIGRRGLAWLLGRQALLKRAIGLLGRLPLFPLIQHRRDRHVARLGWGGRCGRRGFGRRFDVRILNLGLMAQGVFQWIVHDLSSTLRSRPVAPATRRRS